MLSRGAARPRGRSSSTEGRGFKPYGGVASRSVLPGAARPRGPAEEGAEPRSPGRGHRASGAWPRSAASFRPRGLQLLRRALGCGAGRRAGRRAQAAAAAPRSGVGLCEGRRGAARQDGGGPAEAARALPAVLPHSVVGLRFLVPRPRPSRGGRGLGRARGARGAGRGRRGPGPASPWGRRRCRSSGRARGRR